MQNGRQHTYNTSTKQTEQDKRRLKIEYLFGKRVHSYHICEVQPNWKQTGRKLVVSFSKRCNVVGNATFEVSKFHGSIRQFGKKFFTLVLVGSFSDLHG